MCWGAVISEQDAATAHCLVIYGLGLPGPTGISALLTPKSAFLSHPYGNSLDTPYARYKCLTRPSKTDPPKKIYSNNSHTSHNSNNSHTSPQISQLPILPFLTHSTPFTHPTPLTHPPKLPTLPQLPIHNSISHPFHTIHISHTSYTSHNSDTSDTSNTCYTTPTTLTTLTPPDSGPA